VTQVEAQDAVSDAAARLQNDVASPAVASATRRLVVGFVAMVFSLAILGVLASIVRREQLNGLDAAISPFLHAFASPALDTVMNGATFVGSDPVLVGLLVLAVLILMAAHRPRREPLFLLVALPGRIALNQAIKLVVARARPQFDWAHVPTDYSFPSGHSMNSFVFFGAVSLLVWVIGGRRLGAVAIVMAAALVIAIGVSRIYLGAHYFTDVVGGFTAGLLWLLIVAAVFDLEPRLRKRWGR